jgi:hypothetical protein
MNLSKPFAKELHLTMSVNSKVGANLFTRLEAYLRAGDILSIYCDGQCFKQFIYFQKRSVYNARHNSRDARQLLLADDAQDDKRVGR